jgi:hypothetical protein
MLMRLLGETSCRACGATGETVGPLPPIAGTVAAALDGGPCSSSSAQRLSEDVAAALERVLRQGVVSGF